MTHQEAQGDTVAAIAALEHLTGSSRGTVTWLGEPVVDISLDAGGIFGFSAPVADEHGEDVVARLRRVAGGHVIDSIGDNPLWINRQRVRSAQLHHQDMVEFCEHGPISRYLHFDDMNRVHQTVPDIIGDAFGYFRASRKPIGQRAAISAGQIFRRLSHETTIMFRVGVVLALAVLAGLLYQQGRMNMALRGQIESGSAQLEDVSRILARTRDEAVSPGHLETLRQELASRMTTTAERVAELERRTEASARIIDVAARSVVFLQGAYGFREPATGRMLHHVVGDEGQPLMSPNGLPLLSLDGTGPVAERQFTGTGFLVTDGAAGGDYLVTNRHVGVPWEHDASFALTSGETLESVMTRFIAYLPGTSDAASVELVRASDDADVAILRHEFGSAPMQGLTLSGRLPVPGDEVIVMGYPTGLRSILAQAGEAFVEDLQNAGDANFWNIAERLASSGRIVPLASQGIVGRASAETIVYDAATTHGGSGGPVLDIDGAVIAVNSAILPEFGGSNIGVPVAEVRKLLVATTGR